VAVGTNAPNKRDDVLLVQYFLKRIYEKPEDQQLSRPSTPMVVDGYFGPTTRNWILMFQRDYESYCAPVFADGRVDPVVSRSW